jgi:hypothetical protein
MNVEFVNLLKSGALCPHQVFCRIPALNARETLEHHAGGQYGHAQDERDQCDADGH